METLPDKNKRGFQYTYPEIYDAITLGIKPTFIEAIKDELSELVLTTREDIESIEKDAEEIEREKVVSTDVPRVSPPYNE